MVKKKNCKTAYRMNNRGAALMVSVIIIGILIVFTLSLLLVSYTLYASQSKKTAEMSSSEAAVTLSRALDQELTMDDNVTGSSLWNYLRYNLLQDDTVWPYYEEGVSGHSRTEACRYFKVDYNVNYFPNKAPDGFPGNVTICIYWMLPKGQDVPTGQNPYDMTISQKNGTQLVVEVTCETASQSYTVSKTYELNIISYEMSEPTEVSEHNIVRNNASVDEYNPADISSTHFNWEEKWRWAEPKE